MKILVDSRERAPLEFKHPYVTEVIVRKLGVGDYGCMFEGGYLVPVVFERKSIPDLFQTLTKGYRRFRRTMARAEADGVEVALIVEGSLSRVLQGCEFSQIEGDQVVRQMFTLWIKHGVFPVFVKNRTEMADYITRFYYAVGCQYIKEAGSGGNKGETPL